MPPGATRRRVGAAWESRVAASVGRAGVVEPPRARNTGHLPGPTRREACLGCPIME